MEAQEIRPILEWLGRDFGVVWTRAVMVLWQDELPDFLKEIFAELKNSVSGISDATVYDCMRQSVYYELGQHFYKLNKEFTNQRKRKMWIEALDEFCHGVQGE